MRVLLVSPSSSERIAFESAVEACRDCVTLSRVHDHYPDPEVLLRSIRAWAPEAIVLSLDQPEKAEALSQRVLQEFEGIHLIGIHGSQEPEIFRRALRMRMRELITPPFDPRHLTRLADLISEELKKNPVEIGTTNHFYAFLPAKSGVGTSTIAANTAWAISKMPDVRALLADFDLYSGIAGFLFNVEHPYSINDAVNHSNGLDDDSWQKLVRPAGKIDLLLSGAPRLPDHQGLKKVANLIDFARRMYSTIIADLPDSLEGYSLDVLREANRVFLTTTPELPALRLAKLKAQMLQKLELADKSALLVNRHTKTSELSLKEIEKVVGLPVFASFGSAYQDVTTAARNGRASQALKPSFAAFAAKLLAKEMPAKPRFMERFALVPARYSFFAARNTANS